MTGGLPSSLSRFERDVKKSLADEADLEVVIVETRSGRASGWRVKCSDDDHGLFPYELRKKKRAIEVARSHLLAEHDGGGRVRVRRSR